MYESFYGFKEKPFSLLPDPAFLYLASQHSNALAMLEYGLATQAGFTVITGEIGCGKTTLIRHLLDNVDRDVTVGLLSNTQRSIGELLQWILLAFGLDYHAKEKVALYQAFYDFVIDE
jgi:general secretion pathway protein A